MGHVIWKDGSAIRKVALPRGVATVDALARKPFPAGAEYVVIGDDHIAAKVETSRIVVDFNSGTVDVLPDTPAPPTADEYAAAIQAHVDATAKTKGYADGVACASYVASTKPKYQAEAAAFIPWRDDVWDAAELMFAAVQSGQTPPPTIQNFISGLPLIAWVEE